MPVWQYLIGPASSLGPVAWLTIGGSLLIAVGTLTIPRCLALAANHTAEDYGQRRERALRRILDEDQPEPRYVCTSLFCTSLSGVLP